MKKQHNLTGEKSKNKRRYARKPNETEETTIIRRFHDAQRMARFRAKKRKALEEAKISETINFTEYFIIAELKKRNIEFENVNSIVVMSDIEQLKSYLPIQNSSTTVYPYYEQNKYSQLLTIIEELGKNIKLLYAGSRTSAERLKIGIVQAKTLIKKWLLEIEINLHQ
ncbi:uncharacterized protein LOC143182770 [Calliopsis andreniformis]|uniref:uncharacterized protein LOC143182770 n=1 Tax=Calliopsis andreniformis TaxID=337506 RepID=UPI003FCDA396